MCEGVPRGRKNDGSDGTRLGTDVLRSRRGKGVSWFVVKGAVQRRAHIHALIVMTMVMVMVMVIA